MRNASAPVEKTYSKELSALQKEFMAHEEVIKLFLDSSSHLAAAA